jgi:hypothetical protein
MKYIFWQRAQLFKWEIDLDLGFWVSERGGGGHSFH